MRASHLQTLERIVQNPAVARAHAEISNKLEGRERYLPLTGYAADMLGSVALFHLASIRMTLHDDDNGSQLFLRGARLLGDDTMNRRISASIDLPEDETTPLVVKVSDFYSPAFVGDQDNWCGKAPVVDLIAPLVKDPASFPELDPNTHIMDLPANAVTQRGLEVMWSSEKTVKAVLLSNWPTPGPTETSWPPLSPHAAEFSDPSLFKPDLA